MNTFLRHIVFLTEMFLGTLVEAQSFLNVSSYQVGIGGSSMLGDLGGAKGKGTNFIGDFDAKSTRFSGTYALDWAWTNHFEYRTSLNFIYLNATDLNSENHDRSKRNLSVNTSIIELTPSIKYNFLSSKKIKYNKWTPHNFLNIYLTLGTGLIYFNPKATYNGKNYSLKKLTTEGQGLNDGAKEYSKLSVVIPYGVGVSKLINSNSTLFFEVITRKCFTDYLDDVSTVYYDNKILATVNSEESAELADRNTSGEKFLKGTKRGNPGKNDSYFTFAFGFKKTFNATQEYVIKF